jgi:5-carboxymethyl-2-hydroxymuconate isomerase
MPHFIIDRSESIITKISPDDIMKAVYDTAEATGLFASGNIKVRLRPFQYYKLGDKKENFNHIFGYIMEGRGTEQKANLSKQIINNNPLYI